MSKEYQLQFNKIAFNNNQNITSVDLGNLPWVNNSMTSAFKNCYNLISVTNINENVKYMSESFNYCRNLTTISELPNNVTDMSGTFYGCYNLVNAPKIPNKVGSLRFTFAECYNLVNAPDLSNNNRITTMYATFDDCVNLVNAPVIPNSVTDMSYTFDGCVNLVNAPVIPNSVTSMYVTFGICKNLVNAPVIPNSVINMAYTFYNCQNLINVTELPNSVVYMDGMLYHCNNLVNVPEIPYSVNSMYETFSNCTNLIGNIYIHSENIYNTTNCFWNTTLNKDVYIPFKNLETNINTKTFNSFINAGYSTTTRVNGALLIDINRDPELEDWRYDTLYNGVRLLYEYLNKTNPDLIVPANNTLINGYNSSYQTDMPFYNQQQFNSIDLNYTRFYGNYMSNTFYNCQKLTTVTNINQTVRSMSNTFDNCINLVNAPIIPNSVTYMYATFQNCYNLVNAPVIPSSVTSLVYVFDNCHNLKNAPVIPSSVTDMWETFEYCYNLVNAPDMSNAISVTRMYGTFLSCYNLRNAPNLSNCTNLTDMWCTFASCAFENGPVIPNSVTDMGRTFINCQKLVNTQSIPNSVIDMDLTFEDCYNLVNAPDMSNANSLINMANTFAYCSNLVNVGQIPNSVIDMSGTFGYCYNLVNAPDIPYNVEKLYGKNDGGGSGAIFGYCYNLVGDINIYSEKIYIAKNTFVGTSLEKNVYIPFKYQENGSKTLYKIYDDVNNVEYLVDKNPVTSWVGCDIFYNNGIADFNNNVDYIYIASRNNNYVNGTIYYKNYSNSRFNYSVSEHPDYEYVINYNKGDYSTTYNAFIEAGYSTEYRVNGALLMDLYYDELEDWRYDILDNGVRLLYEYLNKTNPDLIVPANRTEINVGTWENSADAPFQNVQQFNSVDLNNVPFKNNSMDYAFHNSSNLTTVTNINENVINMNQTFVQCINLENAPTIPNSVTDMGGTFTYCLKLKNIDLNNCTNLVNMSGTFESCRDLVNAPVIPNSVVDMSGTFLYCHNIIDAPVIPENVTNMANTFFGCENLANISSIPNSVTNMYGTFYDCKNLVNIPVIPNSVNDMSGTFYNCSNLITAPVIPNSVNTIYGEFMFINGGLFEGCANLEGDIYIYSENISDASQCFYNTPNEKLKDVYIHFTNNGVNTATFDAFINAGYSTEYRVNGALLIDIDQDDLKDYQYTYNRLENNKYSVRLYNYIGTTNKIVTPHVN